MDTMEAKFGKWMMKIFRLNDSFNRLIEKLADRIEIWLKQQKNNR